MRRLIFVAMVLALLTGCLSKPKVEETVPEDGELVILFDGTHGRDALNQVVREFGAKYPHVQVRVEDSGPSNNARSEDPSGFEGYDLVIGQGGMAHLLNRFELVQDMSTLNLPPLDPLVADLVLTSFTNGEALHYIPVEFETWMFMLHEETFKTLGLTIPETDWTYTHFEELLRELKSHGHSHSVIPDMLATAVVRAHGGNFYDSEVESWTFDTPENRAGLAFVRRLIEEGLLSDTYSLGIGERVVPLSLKPFRFSMSAGFVALPFPVGPAGRAGEGYGGHGIMMLSTTKRPEAAAAFVRELLSSMAYAEAGARPVYENDEALAVWRDKVGERTVRAVEESWRSTKRFIPAGVVGDYDRDLKLFLNEQISLDQLLLNLETRLNIGH